MTPHEQAEKARDYHRHEAVRLDDPQMFYASKEAMIVEQKAAAATYEAAMASGDLGNNR